MDKPTTPTGRRKWNHRGGPSPYMNVHLDDILAIEAEAAAAGARAERERLRAEVRESGRVGVAIEGQISPAMRSAYSEGFHRGIREALEVLAEPEDA